jgi:hypothetical protein
MIVLKGFVEELPVEFDGNIYGGQGAGLFAKTAEEMIDVMTSVEMLPLKAVGNPSLRPSKLAKKSSL